MATPRPDMAIPFEAGNVGAEAPSMWSQIGDFMGNNADILTALAGQWGKYETQKTKNEAQNYINQAAAKWSGFNPSLMNLVKTPEVQNPVGMVAEAFTGGPTGWYNIQKLYEARKAAQSGENAKMDDLIKKQESRNMINAVLRNAGGY